MTGQQTLDDSTETEDETHLAEGWLSLPSVERAVAHTTPFPAFDAGGASRVGEAVHDTTLAQLRRITEREVSDA